MNEQAKAAGRAGARALVLPAYALYALFGKPHRLFRSLSQLFSLLPGLSGEYLRREFYRLTLKRCAEDCCISFGTIFSTPDVEIGERAYIGAYCILGRVRIGRDCLLASRVSIPSGARQHGTERADILIREQPGVFEEIVIGEDCWIGEGSVVTADIGAHSVIAAGSVVIRPAEPYSVLGGNPASLIKSREA